VAASNFAAKSLESREQSICPRTLMIEQVSKERQFTSRLKHSQLQQ
jgi:hypothetical protein